MNDSIDLTLYLEKFSIRVCLGKEELSGLFIYALLTSQLRVKEHQLQRRTVKQRINSRMHIQIEN